MTTTKHDSDDMPNSGIEQISELIQATNDPETRAVLLILYKIAVTLQKNAEITSKIVADMGTQDEAIKNLTEQFLAQTNRKAGASRILNWMIPLTQSMLLAVCAYLYVDYSQLKTSVTEIKTTLNLYVKGK